MYAPNVKKELYCLQSFRTKLQLPSQSQNQKSTSPQPKSRMRLYSEDFQRLVADLSFPQEDKINSQSKISRSQLEKTPVRMNRYDLNCGANDLNAGLNEVKSVDSAHLIISSNFRERLDDSVQEIISVKSQYIVGDYQKITKFDDLENAESHVSANSFNFELNNSFKEQEFSLNNNFKISYEKREQTLDFENPKLSLIGKRQKSNFDNETLPINSKHQNDNLNGSISVKNNLSMDLDVNSIINTKYISKNLQLKTKTKKKNIKSNYKNSNQFNEFETRETIILKRKNRIVLQQKIIGPQNNSNKEKILNE